MNVTISIPNLLTFPILHKLDILDTASVLMFILMWGLAIFIMIYFHGDWNSFIWYIVNIFVIGIGLLFFIVPGLILWFIWGMRAGWVTAILGGFLGVLGAAIGSSFGYESEGFLK